VGDKVTVQTQGNLKPLITRHFPLDEYQQAYEYIEASKGKSKKVIIDL